MPAFDAHAPWRIPMSFVTMRNVARVLTTLAAVCVSTAAFAFPPDKPYDPRPLSEKAEAETRGDSFTFLVFGDTKGYPGFDGVVARVKKTPHQFVLLTGDMVNRGGRAGDWDRLVTQFGEHRRTVPCWPCYGNHEASGGGYGNYVKFFGLPARYVFDFKNARFICVQAESGPNIDGGQAKWLEKQLGEGKDAGKLLFVWQHGPCYTVGRKRNIPNRPTRLSGLCEKYRVVANFAGHDHIYYRTKRGSVWYMIQGAGGAGVYDLNREREARKGDVYFGCVPNTGWKKFKLHNAKGEKFFDKPMYLFTSITVKGKQVTGKTVAAETGEVFDEFVLREEE
jgi:hypothetical protein